MNLTPPHLHQYFKPHTLRVSQWLCLIVSLSTLLSALAVSAYSQRSFQRWSTEQFDRRTDQQMRRLSNTLTHGVRVEDRVSLTLLLTTWQTTTELPALRVYNAANTLLAELKYQPNIDDLTVMRTPIVQDGTTIGVLEASIDRRALTQQHTRHLTMNVLLSALFSIAFGALAYGLGGVYERRQEALQTALKQRQHPTPLLPLSAEQQHWYDAIAQRQSDDDALNDSHTRALQLHPVCVAPSTGKRHDVTVLMLHAKHALALQPLVVAARKAAKVYHATLAIACEQCVTLVFKHEHRTQHLQSALYAARVIQTSTRNAVPHDNDITVVALLHQTQAYIYDIEHPLSHEQIQGDDIAWMSKAVRSDDAPNGAPLLISRNTKNKMPAEQHGTWDAYETSGLDKSAASPTLLTLISLDTTANELIERQVKHLHSIDG